MKSLYVLKLGASVGVCVVLLFFSENLFAGKVKSLARLRGLLTANIDDAEAFIPTTIGRYNRMLQTGVISGSPRNPYELTVYPSIFGIGTQAAYSLAEHRAKGLAGREFFYRQIGIKSVHQISDEMSSSYQYVRGIQQQLIQARVTDPSISSSSAINEMLEVYDALIYKAIQDHVFSIPRITKLKPNLKVARAAVERSMDEEGLVLGVRNLFQHVFDGTIAARTGVFDYEEWHLAVKGVKLGAKRINGIPFSYAHSITPVGNRSWFEVTTPIHMTRFGMPW